MNIKTMIKNTFAIAAVLSAGPAMALVISPVGCDYDVDSDAATTCWKSNDNSQPDLQDFADLLDIDDDGLVILYKADVPREIGAPVSESGDFGDDYDTVFSNSSIDPEDATVSHVGPSSIACPECYLWVKDGNQTPALYVFDLGSWDGTDSLQLSGFWPNQGAISNIGIFGRRGGDMQVPEPGTLGLLGIAALGLGFVRRRKA